MSSTDRRRPYSYCHLPPMLATDIGIAVVSVAAVFVPEKAYLQASNVQGLYIGLGPRALHSCQWYDKVYVGPIYVILPPSTTCMHV